MLLRHRIWFCILWIDWKGWKLLHTDAYSPSIGAQTQADLRSHWSIRLVGAWREPGPRLEDGKGRLSYVPVLFILDGHGHTPHLDAWATHITHTAPTDTHMHKHMHTNILPHFNRYSTEGSTLGWNAPKRAVKKRHHNNPVDPRSILKN